MPKGRPREFQVDEALDKALLVFWEKGYRGTSLDDLTEAMNINRPSLYSAFTDKENLFLSVVDRYRSRFLSRPTKKLMEADSLREGLSEFLSGMGNVILSEETPPGCMVACLLSEECCDSDAIKAKLKECIESTDSTLARVFESHSDELREGLDPGMAARLLTSFLHGASIRARSGCSKRELQKLSIAFIKVITRSL